MPIPLIGFAASLQTWIVGLIGTGIAKFIVDKILMFLAFKLILTTLFVIVLPIVLNNLIYDLMEIGTNMLLANASTPEGYNGAMQFTGMMAWLVDCFNLPECLSILVGAIQLRLVLSNIPFVNFRA
jgi:TM2 domain-containing membrane protein YozV